MMEHTSELFPTPGRVDSPPISRICAPASDTAKLLDGNRLPNILEKQMNTTARHQVVFCYFDIPTRNKSRNSQTLSTSSGWALQSSPSLPEPGRLQDNFASSTCLRTSESSTACGVWK